jgi:hypothetical protein
VLLVVARDRKAAAVTGTSVLVIAPWVVFAAGLAVLCAWLGGWRRRR